MLHGWTMRERLKLVIDQLDELFVGTLDSFSQKLLREFAFESGKIERVEITDDAKQYTQQLIHDVYCVNGFSSNHKIFWTICC